MPMKPRPAIPILNHLRNSLYFFYVFLWIPHIARIRVIFLRFQANLCACGGKNAGCSEGIMRGFGGLVRSGYASRRPAPDGHP